MRKKSFETLFALLTILCACNIAQAQTAPHDDHSSVEFKSPHR